MPGSTLFAPQRQKMKDTMQRYSSGVVDRRRLSRLGDTRSVATCWQLQRKGSVAVTLQLGPGWLAAAGKSQPGSAGA